MSKNKKKKNQQPVETPQERARRLAAQAGMIQEQKPVEPEDATEADSVSLPENLPDDAGDEALSFLESLEETKRQLAEVEKKLREREASLDRLVQEKSDEYIKSLGIDVPTAQEEVKELLAKAEQEKERLIAEGQRIADDLKAKAAISVDDADAVLARANEREQALAKLAEELSKKQITLQNEELSYRKTIGDEIAAEYKKQIEQIDTFEAEKAKLQKKAEHFKKLYEDLLQQLEDLQGQLSDYEVKKRELTSKESDCSILENEVKGLRGKIEELKAQLSRIGADPMAYKNQYEALEKDYIELQNRLANMPGDLELSQLRTKAEELEKISAALAKSESELLEAKSELTSLRVKASQVDDYIQYVRILTESKRQLQNELASLQDQYESENNNKFKALSSFDANVPAPSNLYPFQGTLNALVLKFLGYAQNEPKPLYYEPSTIAAFLSWMASTKTIILEGLSGTGKTSLPLAFERFAGWYTPRVSVQSAWKDRNDLIGFFNDFKKEYKETEFLKDLYRASQLPERPALIILDEMNLSRIEYYFADFLSALEEPDANRRVIDLLPDQSNGLGMPKLFVEGGKLPIRPNIWFVGTANKDDSTFAITDKVYDRAGVIHFSSKGKMSMRRGAEERTFVPYQHLQRLFNFAKEHFDSKCEEKYREVRDVLVEALSVYFEINIGNRIMDQMDIFVPVYLNCMDSNEIKTVYEAIDEFLPYKVLRKLEGVYDANTKKNIGDMIASIREYGLPKTKAYLQMLQSKID